MVDLVLAGSLVPLFIQKATRVGAWRMLEKKNLAQSQQYWEVSKSESGFLQCFVSWCYSRYANIDIVALPKDDQFLGL